MSGGSIAIQLHELLAANPRVFSAEVLSNLAVVQLCKRPRTELFSQDSQIAAPSLDLGNCVSDRPCTAIHVDSKLSQVLRNVDSSGGDYRSSIHHRGGQRMSSRPAGEWNDARLASLINVGEFVGGVEVPPLDHIGDILADGLLFGLFQTVATIANINHELNAGSPRFKDHQRVQQLREALPSRDIVPAKIDIWFSFSGHEFWNSRAITDDFDFVRICAQRDELLLHVLAVYQNLRALVVETIECFVSHLKRVDLMHGCYDLLP